jgi:hypothetical protein
MAVKERTLLDLFSDITEKEISPYLTLKELSQLAQTCRGTKTLFAESTVNAKVAALLQHVALGEQEEAERILKADPTLLLRTGEVTDYSGRTFKHITAFQYALWALDRHMWTMILKYLPPEEAAKQLRDHVDNKKAYKDMHGDYYDFALVGALQTYSVCILEQRSTQWGKVGEAQFLAPAHVANEYCRKNLYFSRSLGFKDDILPRSIRVHTASQTHWHWYMILKGQNFAMLSSIEGAISLHLLDPPPVPMLDLAMMIQLCKVRTDELSELKQQLLNPAQEQALEELNPPSEKSWRVIS